MMWRRPKRPDLLPEVLAEFELQGADAVRSMMAAYQTASLGGDLHGTMREARLTFGNVKATRGEMQDWLKWKAGADTYWLKVGVIAAVIAAVAAVIAAWPVIHDWIK